MVCGNSEQCSSKSWLPTINPRPPVTKIKASDKQRVFQNERHRRRRTSYETSKHSIAAEKPPETNQKVNKMPRERNMPLFGVTKSAKILWAKPMLAPGKKPAIDAQRSGQFWSSPARRSLLRDLRSLRAQICKHFARRAFLRRD
jgi:hypothetical protein